MVTPTRDIKNQSTHIGELLRSLENRAKLEEAMPILEALGLRVEQARTDLEALRNSNKGCDRQIELAKRDLKESIDALVAYLREVVR